MKHNVLFYKGYGKIGNMVGYSIYGKQAFRAYNPVVANPKSADQQLQRAKIALLTKLLQVFKPAIKMGFKDEARARGCSAVNFFTHKNYPNVTGTAPDNTTIDPSKIEVAQGAIPNVVFGSTINVSTPNQVLVSVTDINAGVAGASASDSIYVFVYCPDMGMGILSAAAGRTVGAALTVRVPESWSGLEVHVYGWVISGDEDTLGQSSNSEYIGHAELA